jgi:membrane protein YqaA with SNARE-associated domain
MDEEFKYPANVETTLSQVSNRFRTHFRMIVFFFEITMVIGLLIWWFSSDTVHKSQNLWVFFFYCFPAEFIIATVPHEPVLVYFAKFYSPLTLALIAMVGTVLTEILNYTAFRFVADIKLFQKMLSNKAVSKTVALFNRAPFLALWIAGFTPIPFYPFRFLVVIARYPLIKYILAVILSRTPRFFLLALLGRALKLSDSLLLVLTVVLITIVNIPILARYLRKKWRSKRLSADNP